MKAETKLRKHRNLDTDLMIQPSVEGSALNSFSFIDPASGTITEQAEVVLTAHLNRKKPGAGPGEPSTERERERAKRGEEQTHRLTLF